MEFDLLEFDVNVYNRLVYGDGVPGQRVVIYRAFLDEKGDRYYNTDPENEVFSFDLPAVAEDDERYVEDQWYNFDQEDMPAWLYRECHTRIRQAYREAWAGM